MKHVLANETSKCTCLHLELTAWKIPLKKTQRGWNNTLKFYAIFAMAIQIYNMNFPQILYFGKVERSKCSQMSFTILNTGVSVQHRGKLAAGVACMPYVPGVSLGYSTFNPTPGVHQGKQQMKAQVHPYHLSGRPGRSSGFLALPRVQFWLWWKYGEGTSKWEKFSLSDFVSLSFKQN